MNGTISPRTKPAASTCKMNILNMMALSVLCFVGLTLALWTSGSGLIWALLVGWLGAGTAACGFAMVSVAFQSVTKQRDD